MSPRIGAVAAAVVFVASVAFAVGGADEVKLISKQIYKGNIISDTYKGVVIRLSQGKVEVSAQDIAGVTYAEGPIEYRSAEAPMKNENWLAALQYLNIALAKNRNKLLTQYIYFKIAFCHEQMGHIELAIKAYQLLLRDVPDTRFLPTAAERVVHVYIQQEKFRQAMQLIEKLESLGPKWALRAALLKGQVFIAQKKLTRADRLFKEIYEENQGDEGPEAAEALILRARVRILREEFPAAVEFALKAIREAKRAPRVTAMAYVFLGDAYFGMAKGAEASVLDDALFAYLHVPVLYGGKQESEAKALYQAGLCFRYKNQGARADLMFNRLLDKYATSRWGKEARRELDR